jgi:hypothetical protein
MTDLDSFDYAMKQEEFMDVDKLIEKYNSEYILPLDKEVERKCYQEANLFDKVTSNFIERGTIKLNICDRCIISIYNLQLIQNYFNKKNPEYSLKFINKKINLKCILCVITFNKTNEITYLFCICSINVKKIFERKKILCLVELPISDSDEKHKFAEYLDLSDTTKKSFFKKFKKVFKNSVNRDFIIKNRN